VLPWPHAGQATARLAPQLLQNLAAGATAKSLKIVVKVKPTAKVGAIQKLKVTATSGVSAMDVVKGKLKTVR
jgi:hypothetical protein